ncbi:hypothetical protein JTE90_028078 [Oedothorax gibbosus]|uniref:Uncharacterized protein n=1 Tax=Oedothorax gibbosus TaxID=931172 RepID=A0AAV6VAG1_9ARAC|nr:hypothetical protein JTE90_028078 [Oedothorax gibbosus]
MTSRIILLSWFGVLFCSSWINIIQTESANNQEKNQESSDEFHFLTPQTYTEPLAPKPLTAPFSQDVTPDNTSGDLYDQILPSREPTTPLTRNFLYEILKSNEVRDTHSTLATTINSPPPLYKIY